MDFEKEKLAAFLRETAELTDSSLFCVHLFDSLPSTNQKLWQLLAEGAKPGTVVIAREQTAGRGQWGRQWSSPAGGLYLSFALAANLPAAHSYQLTLSSAWGIATALRDRGIPVGLKWLNDLILESRKLGGILTETKVRHEKITLAVVGVGINWSNSVPPTGINLDRFSAITCLEMLAAITLQGIVLGDRLRSQAPIDTLIASYQQLLTNVGQEVTVDGRAGVVVGITPRGDLRIRFVTKNTGAIAEEIYLQPGAISLGYNC